MLLAIENVLSNQELANVRGLYAKARFGDGRVTAGELAAKAKNNLQLAANAAETQVLTGIVHDALHCNPLFVSAALPKVVCPPLFNRYVPGMDFGTHVDNAIRISAVTLRADVSGTLFLSEPEEYSGGELLIEDTYGVQTIKLSAGSLVLYPSSSLHRVEPITDGHRDVAVFWVQSMVRDIAQRSLLFQLDASIQGLRARSPESPEIVSLVSTYHNLLRMWADI
ncbi:PKHD-type hydroxylase [Methyloglobulus morosus KoM1]|uniref:PKHD-type hydroxylase n=1 Tax=Methyloglobulus morosus KoM1 TaxID=1116472 RepID=V5BUA1_9GAMM|nr:Fe2+-dependent dioxygenase [Methyloglobulus morosus]ESS71459.1 PKHD-type hydroxylase [Methyloglobulus morosus KoM1]